MQKIKLYEHPITVDGYINKKGEKTFIGVGLFHEWGSNFEEFETGAGNYSVGIVELENGEIKLVDPVLIQFVKGTKKETR